VIVHKSVNIIDNVDKGAELMGLMTPGLAGQKGLRGEILIQLKKSQPATAKELAAVFDVSPNAIRRHLKELEAEGLVEYRREHRGSGAPTYAFKLSEDGEGLFPTRYGEVLNEVLGLVARGGGRSVVKEIFADRFREHAERIRAEMPDATVEEKLDAIAGMLSDQGFMAAWDKTQDTLTLAQHNCAIRTVAEAFPEICAAETEFLRDVLGAEVTRESHITEGCNACQYHIAVESSSRASTSGTADTRGDGRDE
jgi:DeoR family suf operon transcriptional repressor